LRRKQNPAEASGHFFEIRLAKKNFRLIFGLAEFYGTHKIWPKDAKYIQLRRTNLASNEN